MTEENKNKQTPKDDLNDLFNEVSSDTSDKEAKKALVKKQKDRKYKPYLITGAIIAALAVGAYFAYPQFSSMFGGDNKTEEVSKDDSANKNKADDTDGNVNEDDPESEDYVPSEGDNEDAAKRDAAKQKEEESAIPLADWQKVSRSEGLKNKDQLKQELIEYVDGTPLTTTVGSLVATKDGYTDDISKAEDSNYSFQTKENVAYDLGMAMNMILNPVFGEWNTIPYGQPGAVEAAFPDDTWQPLFSEKWWADNVKEGDHSKLPLFLDWAGDSYGGLEFAPGIGPWLGEVTLVSSNIEANPNGEGSVITVDADVTFHGTLEKGDKVERKGNLKLKFEQNDFDTYERTGVRNVITEASLTMQ